MKEGTFLNPKLTLKKQLTREAKQLILHNFVWEVFCNNYLKMFPQWRKKPEEVSLPYKGKVEDHLKSQDWIIIMNREGIYGVSDFFFIFRYISNCRNFKPCFSLLVVNISTPWIMYLQDIKGKIVGITLDNLFYFPSLILNSACG